MKNNKGQEITEQQHNKSTLNSLQLAKPTEHQKPKRDVKALLQRSDGWVTSLSHLVALSNRSKAVRCSGHLWASLGISEDGNVVRRCEKNNEWLDYRYLQVEIVFTIFHRFFMTSYPGNDIYDFDFKLRKTQLGRVTMPSLSRVGLGQERRIPDNCE